MKRTYSILKFSAIISLLSLVLYNLPFFQFVLSHANQDAFPKYYLVASLVVVLVALNFMMTYLLLTLTRVVGKVILVLIHLINATAVYFITTYHVLMTDSMVGNVFNTRYSEASGFFSWKLIAWVLVFGVLPAVWILMQKIKYDKWKELGKVCAASIGVTLLLVLSNINQTLWIGQYDTELGGLVMPWSYIVNTCRLMSEHEDEEVKEEPLPDGKITDEDKTAVVLVIGESSRKANWQLYGYHRPTNPLLSQLPGLHVLPAQSCGTYTTAGCRAILEPTEGGALKEILPNYAYRTGVDVSWRTSNWGEPPVHIQEYLDFQDLGKMYKQDNKYDDILLAGLKERIESSQKNKVLIVLHTSTSHGPEYTAKYPKQFEIFKPVPANVEESNKQLDKLVNSYDNTIVYTDYLLNSLIDTLQTVKGWRTAMVYISDHGESLGEKNMFMHGLPLKMAPKQQYEIPFVVWLSGPWRDVKPFSNSGKEEKGKLPTPLQQHYIFHSILDLLSIQSPAYQEDRDIFLKK